MTWSRPVQVENHNRVTGLMSFPLLKWIALFFCLWFSKRSSITDFQKPSVEREWKINYLTKQTGKYKILKNFSYLHQSCRLNFGDAFCTYSLLITHIYLTLNRMKHCIRRGKRIRSYMGRACQHSVEGKLPMSSLIRLVILTKMNTSYLRHNAVAM